LTTFDVMSTATHVWLSPTCVFLFAAAATAVPLRDGGERAGLNGVGETQVSQSIHAQTPTRTSSETITPFAPPPPPTPPPYAGPVTLCGEIPGANAGETYLVTMAAVNASDASEIVSTFAAGVPFTVPSNDHRDTSDQ
jgi:hypothetical protein